MFICNSCLEDKYTNGPTLFRSVGRCEGCGGTCECSDWKCSDLELKPSQDESTSEVAGIDAKRLAKMMEPDSLQSIAGFLDEVRKGISSVWGVADQLPHRARGAGSLEIAAAVLRKVAEREETPKTCCLSDCDKQATAGPLCGPHLLDFAPITCCVNGCKDAGTTEDGTPLTARVAFGEVPVCPKHYELWREARKVEGVTPITPDAIRDVIQGSDDDVQERCGDLVAAMGAALAQLNIGEQNFGQLCEAVNAFSASRAKHAEMKAGIAAEIAEEKRNG